MFGALLRQLVRAGLRRSEAAPATQGGANPAACLQALVAGNLDEAIGCYRSHLALHPDDADSHNNLGVALHRAGRRAEALASHRAAIRLAPTHAEAWYNAGLMYHVAGNIDLAEEHYRNALRANAAHAEANREYSMLRLAQGDFSPGVWRAFRHRRLCAGFEATISRHPAPVWDGESLHGKSVLVYGEQGLGDEILFASCYPDLIERCEHCVIQTEPRLEALFRRSFPRAEVIGRNRDPERAAPHPGIAVKVPCGDLPLHFRASPESFAGRGPYLRADANAIARWRQVLGASGSTLNVGVSWRGGTTRSAQAARSIDLQDWLPVLHVPGVRLVNLQYGDCEHDLERVRASLGAEILHVPDALADYDETAALVSALDLVITVTTSIAHLAGALGQRLWILANAAPRWCYMANGERTPWYPSARIFRQRREAGWSPVMTEVANALARAVRMKDCGGAAA